MRLPSFAVYHLFPWDIAITRDLMQTDDTFLWCYYYEYVAKLLEIIAMGRCAKTIGVDTNHSYSGMVIIVSG